MKSIQIGDFVLVKDGVKLEGGQETANWGGQVVEIYPEYKTCLIELDAMTLNSLDDEYLLECMEEGDDALGYVFYQTDLVQALPRNTEEELVAAQDRIEERMTDLGGEPFDPDTLREDILDTLIDSWPEEFAESARFDLLTPSQQDQAFFVIETFMDIAYNLEGLLPEDWTTGAVKEICLDIVPQKITDEMSLFEAYGDVLFQFFAFLDEAGYIDNARELMHAVEQIKTEIPQRAGASENWGLAKSLMMEIQEAGVDVFDPNAMEEFIETYNLKVDSEFAGNHRSEAEEDPLAGIDRDQKITVRYLDGTVKDQIKFKQVEKDLRDGKCILIRK